MTAAWIIGANGLLGSALQRTLQRRGMRLFVPADCFCWHDEAVLHRQLLATVKAFADFTGGCCNWQIYWAAGVGTMSSKEEELATETRTLSTILKLIESEPALMAADGSFAFSSSAGAIYAGASDDVITENTAVAPTTDYAKEKLRQEKLVSEFAHNNSRVTALLARISTLYGPGQANGKRQGLLAHIARCLLRNQSVHIYVPFDTIRDYIATDDAAFAIGAAMQALNGTPGVFTKIIASEHPTTIAEIISVYKRIARRKPRIVSSASKLSSLYTRRIQFQSITVPIKERMLKTSLLIGISQVMDAERSAFTRTGR
ncbi:MAG: NAD-dependent epimerase/dehydratase family protein [Gammaproteobacteria bacterium]|nr:MAG: NAD-dependent epimerase/dehydratase family protein [Gammaproteobacteria bacterium]